VCEDESVKGSEFPRKLHVLGKARGVGVGFVPKHGKGSHGRVFFGSSFTTLKDRKKEIPAGLLKAMCTDLGIRPSDL
jgi:hypothetical protein